VLLLRDMGALDDQICRLVDVPGLARVQPCGQMILRTDSFAFTKTEPEQLVSACLERIKQGARWVKVFADWSDDFSGHQNSGFKDSDEVTYPLEVLSQAVREVHAAGGRVAAHCFTKAGAEVSILAGVDSLEHGWGLDDSLVHMLAERNIAWVPLVGIAPHMWRVAHAAGETERCAWIVQTMSDLGRLLPLAEALGVRVLVGTDMFPSVTVIDEIRQLCELGLSPEAAVGGGSWGARAWLGETLLTHGAPADLVLFQQDPRKDLGVLTQPRLILVGGTRVAPSFAHARPVFVTWSQLMQSVVHESKVMP
jgi:imidazolonepropionase-like amidohydrolase